MHALVGRLDLELVAGTPAQGGDQPVALVAVERAHAADVRGEVAFGDERRQHRLLQRTAGGPSGSARSRSR